MVDAAGTTETFAHNGDGVRLSRTDSSGTTRFFWKKGLASYAQGIGMDDLAFEADGSNQMTAAYHYGAGLVGMSRASSNYWYHYDNLGTTRLVTDSSQATAASYVYDAFGNIRSQTGSLTNPYDYVGELGYFTDPGPSGLLFLRARYYVPAYGRHSSPDPVTRDRPEYSYAVGCPGRWTDPAGLKATNPAQRIYYSVLYGKYDYWDLTVYVWPDDPDAEWPWVYSGHGPSVDWGYLAESCRKSGRGIGASNLKKVAKEIRRTWELYHEYGAICYGSAPPRKGKSPVYFQPHYGERGIWGWGISIVSLDPCRSWCTQMHEFAHLRQYQVYDIHPGMTDRELACVEMRAYCVELQCLEAAYKMIGGAP